MRKSPIIIELPGEEGLRLEELALDYTGTLSLDGFLLPGVSGQLVQLSNHVRITVLTADTFGTAADALADLPLSVHLVPDGAAKARFVKELGPERVAAVGNGRNDEAMLRMSALGIAVIGPEGLHTSLVQAADVVVTDIGAALDLLLHPLRLKATLRK